MSRIYSIYFLKQIYGEYYTAVMLYQMQAIYFLLDEHA